MKIGPIDSKVTPSTTTGTERRSGSTAAPASTEPSARVQLSSASTLAASGPDDGAFDKAKVDRISAAIREGRFEVNAGAIADKLISNAQELLGRKSN